MLEWWMANAEYIFLAGLALGVFSLVGLVAGPIEWAADRLYRRCMRDAAIARLTEGGERRR